MIYTIVQRLQGIEWRNGSVQEDVNLVRTALYYGEKALIFADTSEEVEWLEQHIFDLSDIYFHIFPEAIPTEEREIFHKICASLIDERMEQDCQSLEDDLAVFSAMISIAKRRVNAEERNDLARIYSNETIATFLCEVMWEYISGEITASETIAHLDSYERVIHKWFPRYLLQERYPAHRWSDIFIDAWACLMQPDARKASAFAYPNGRLMSVREAKMAGYM